MKKTVALMVVLLLAAGPAFAACAICNGVASDNIAKHAGCKFLRGLANTGLGWTELIVTPVSEAKAGNDPVVGLFKGIGNTLLRTGNGVVEVLTFPIPGSSPWLKEDSACPLESMQSVKGKSA